MVNWLRYNNPFGWRFVIAMLATGCLNLMLLEVAGFNFWVVLTITGAVGWWLGMLAGAADWEERRERFQAAQAMWQKRFEEAYRKMGYRVMKGKGDDIQGS
jgi:hypothetical protein